MKKLASIMLALTLVLGMSNVAFAADGTSSEAKTFTFEKRYETSAGETPATFPTETLKFSVTADEGNPDGTMITIADHTVASNPGSVVVTVPTYSKVGKWNYTVSEVAGTTQGVTYASNSFGVQVLVNMMKMTIWLQQQHLQQLMEKKEKLTKLLISMILETYQLKRMFPVTWQARHRSLISM